MHVQIQPQTDGASKIEKLEYKKNIIDYTFLLRVATFQPDHAKLNMHIYSLSMSIAG